MSEAFACIEVLMVVLRAVSANEKECLWYFRICMLQREVDKRRGEKSLFLMVYRRMIQ